MAPKKNDENTTKKTPKKRVVKPKPEKPKLRTPTVLKIKIPLNSSGPNGVTPKLSKKQLTVQKKLELANEVALDQLTKDTITTKETLAPIVPEPKVPNTTKGKRKPEVKFSDKPVKLKRKKITFNNAVIPGSDTDSEVFEKNTPKAKVPRKSAPKKIDIENKDEKIETTEPVVQKRRGRRALSIKKKESLAEPKEKSATEVDGTTTNVETTDPAVDDMIIKEEIIDPIVTDSIKEAPVPKVTKARKIQNTIPNGVSTRSLRRRKAVPNKIIQNVPKVATAVNTSTKSAEVLSDDKKASVVESRKSSVNSMISCPSWTQDISTSSTTTCITVTSNDFVRFNKKVPVVQVENLGAIQQPEKAESSSSSSSSSGSSTSSSSSSDSEEVEGARELDLSTSSSGRAARSCVDIDALSEALDRLTGSLRDFSAELQPPRPAAPLPRTPAAVYDALKLENETITLCRNLKRILGATPAIAEFVRPAPPRTRARDEPRPPVPAAPAPEPHGDDATPTDASHDDDDDALSLFAESITGIESSRQSALDEYVPAPVAAPPAPRRYLPTRIEPSPAPGRYRPTGIEPTPTPAPSHDRYSPTRFEPLPAPALGCYRPTRIDPAPAPGCYRPTRIELAPEPAPRPAPVCEKHSADSTSLRDAGGRDPPSRNREGRGSELRDVETEVSKATGALARASATGAEFAMPASPGRSALHALSTRRFTSVAPSHSAVFRGVCFFNLAAQCRMDPCRFPHAPLDAREVRRRLAPLGDGAVVRELALVLAHPALRRAFAAPFALECARRGLTRALLEAAAGAGAGADATAALEAALLHLNDVDLSEVADAVTRSLFDAMLRTLADTPNFSRFRPVFAKLARLAAERALSVPSDVATKILERVVILPCEETLARAMLTLASVTDARVRRGDLMARFEAQLAGAGGALHAEYVAWRRAPTPPPAPAAPPAPPDQEERYTSPDTTHYDTLNNLPIAPMITRIVDLKRSRTDTALVAYDPSIPPPQLPSVKNPFTWRKTYPQRPSRPNGALRTPGNRPVQPNTLLNDKGNRRTIKRWPVEMTYGAPNNYQRMPGDF